MAGFRYKASFFEPRLYYTQMPNRRSAGALTAHIDGTRGCGDAGALSLAGRYLGRRSGTLRI